MLQSSSLSSSWWKCKGGSTFLRVPSLLSEEWGLFAALGTCKDDRQGSFRSSSDNSVPDVTSSSTRIFLETMDAAEPLSPLVQQSAKRPIGQSVGSRNPTLVDRSLRQWSNSMMIGSRKMHQTGPFAESVRGDVHHRPRTFASQMLHGICAMSTPAIGRQYIHTSSIMCDDDTKKSKPTKRRRKNSAASSNKNDGPPNGHGQGGELTAADDEPFRAITDKIPQRPMTVVEGTSYTLVIIAALGFAAAVLYAALSELVFSPKEYTCFSNALKRIEDDPRVTIRLGTPLSAYGTESRNRSARQRIPHRIYNDEEGREHVQLQFHAKGPSGRATVHADMYQEDGSWKYHYLYLNVESPLPQQVVLIRPFQPDNE